MQRWRIDVEYDGEPYAGWQIQPNGNTVQAELERAVEKIFGHPARVCASGRTDAGVHAEHQVASFVAQVDRRVIAVRDGLNHFLPDSIVVLDALPVPASFDPRRQVKEKTYRYQWLDRPTRSPLLGPRCWHVRKRLDVDAMQKAARYLEGSHDFSSFQAKGCQADHAKRTVPSLELSRRRDVVVLTVMGHGFLRHMIRIIAGTLTEVGQGRRPPHWVEEVLHARNRAAAGRTAPAKGLTLQEVRYP